MKLFNAFQLAVLFAAWPFILQWVEKSNFGGAAALWYLAVVAYVVHFCFSVAAWFMLIDMEGK